MEILSARLCPLSGSKGVVVSIWSDSSPCQRTILWIFRTLVGTTHDRVPMTKLAKVVHPHCKQLHFQEKANWCWVATTSNVESCHGKLAAQCGIAAKSLPNYSVQCSTDACNIPYYLCEALKVVNKLQIAYRFRIKRTLVQRELDKKRPIGVRISWSGSDDGHFILIVGYGLKERDRNQFFYLIFDPLKGQGFQVLPASAMERPNGYNGTGTWTETILTT